MFCFNDIFLKVMYMIFWKWSINREHCKRSDKIINKTIINENKREEIGNKLSEREMITQIGLNPFLNNSYDQDICNYDKCMKK